MSGNFSLERTFSSGETGSASLFAGGLDIEFRPPLRKLKARFNIPLRFAVTDESEIFGASPVGDFVANISGDRYSINLRHGRFVSVSNLAELTETQTSRAAFSLLYPLWPTLGVSYSRTESTRADRTDRTDTVSLFSDYRYKWLNFRGGYSTSERSASTGPSRRSHSLLFGVGGNYTILPRTTVTGGVDIGRSVTELTAGRERTSLTTDLRLGAATRPFDWLGVSGQFSKYSTDSESVSSEQQVMSMTTTFFLSPYFNFSAGVGNRRFDDVNQQRSVTFKTLAADFRRRLVEKIDFGIRASRTYSTDPDQGESVSDTIGLNSTMDLTPRIALRFNASVNRDENRDFITERLFNASGALDERALYDDRPAGFIFFDTVNEDLYTKNSDLLADWSPPVHLELITERFSVSKSLQVNMIPTDKTSLTLSYSSSAASDQLDLLAVGSQSLNLSLVYRPNRRTSYSASGSTSLPEKGETSSSGTVTMAYRFFRGHQLNLGYSRSESRGDSFDSLTAVLGLNFRKRTGVQLIYSASQPFQDDQSYFLRASFSKRF